MKRIPNNPFIPVFTGPLLIRGYMPSKFGTRLIEILSKF
jgi:hypothetical protein